MGKVKGCPNKKCVSNKKKIKFNKTDDYCPKCGEKLIIVCKKCYMQLPDNSKRLCERCLAKKEDKKNKAKKSGVAGAATASGLAALAITITKNGPKISEFLLKLKG